MGRSGALVMARSPPDSSTQPQVITQGFTSILFLMLFRTIRFQCRQSHNNVSIPSFPTFFLFRLPILDDIVSTGSDLLPSPSVLDRFNRLSRFFDRMSHHRHYR